MLSYNKEVIIGLLLLVLFLAYWFSSSMQTSEPFTSSPFNSSKELDNFYHGSTMGIENDLVDNMTCHPSCCGSQWPVPFDGLTSSEVQKCLNTKTNSGPYVRTDYTCANGINGVGCPCIDKDAYIFMTNRGQNAQRVEKIEPTFLMHNNINEQIQPYERDMVSQSAYEELQSAKSMRRNSPKINDLDLQREPVNLQRVQSYNSDLPFDDKKVNATHS